MDIRTKIICTIGPATNTFEKMVELIQAGMNVARFNFSHGTHEEHLKNITNLKKARELCKSPVAIMLDTKGPEIRIGKFKNNEVVLKPRQKMRLIKEEAQKDDEIQVKPFEVLNNIEPGHKILFDDGYIIAQVISAKPNEVIIEIQNQGILKSSKRINIPNVKIDLPAVTVSDILDLKFGAKVGIDIVAASFVRSAEHVLEIKQILADENCSDVMVISKIENHEGVDNFDEIVSTSDGIMVARGDLGVEVDISLVPKYQKMMISKCFYAAKPVIIATQMLESMINNPRPTRAEVSDVANAIYDSASCVMLSAETASGKYPVETVKQMKNIILTAEADFDYSEFFYRESRQEVEDISSSVAFAAVKTAYTSNASAIFAITKSGFTARLLGKLRPRMPIVVLTKNERKYHQLACQWGVFPVFAKKFDTAEEAFSILSQFSEKKGLIKFGDLTVFVCSYPFEMKGSANVMLVENIGKILVRGYKGHGQKTKGTLVKLLSCKNKDPALYKGMVVLIKKFCDDYLPILQVVNGIILQNHKNDIVSETKAMVFAQENNIPLVVRAKNADEVLDDGDFVNLDPEKGLVYIV